MLNIIKSKIILVPICLIVLGIILGSVNSSNQASGHASAISDFFQTILTPANRAFSGLLSVVGNSTRAARPRSYILRENARLKRQVRSLTMENSRLHELAYQKVLIERELGYRQTININMFPAQVISHNLSSWFDTATIDKGKNIGVEKGCAVVNHLGLIGQVVSVGNRTSQIVSLNDPNSAVGGMVQRSRAKGIIQGQWSEYLVFAYLKKDADVMKGDIVVSSGDGKVIPKGIVIGRVENVIRDSITGTTNALVKPSVRFDEIEYVFVVISGQVVSK